MGFHATLRHAFHPADLSASLALCFSAARFAAGDESGRGNEQQKKKIISHSDYKKNHVGCWHDGITNTSGGELSVGLDLFLLYGHVVHEECFPSGAVCLLYSDPNYVRLGPKI